MSLFSELKRRNVFRVAIAYLAAAWLLVEVTDTIFPYFNLGETAVRILIILLAIGLPLFLVFSWVFELTPEGLKLEKDIDRAGPAPSSDTRRLDRAIIVLLVLALGYFAVDKFVLEPGRVAEIVEETAEQARSEALVKSYGDKSIAVLPFVNMSADPEQEYFSDGISEELLNLLAQIPGLRVISRSSSFMFKNKDISTPEIAKQLNVAHILEGSVRKAGVRARITAQLIEAHSDTHIWSKTYDRTLDDIFAVQDEIAAAISDALKIELSLTEGQSAVPTAIQASSSAAYDAYLRGRALVQQRDYDRMDEAMDNLKRALRLDGNFAPAHAQLAIAALMQGGVSTEEKTRQAVPHLDRAQELEPDLAEAHGGRALIARMKFDWTATVEHAQKALAVNPNYIDALHWLRTALSKLGRTVEADALLEKMLTIDPLSVPARTDYAFWLSRQGRIEEAHELADQLITFNPSRAYRAHSMISIMVEGKLADGLYWALQAPISEISAFWALTWAGEYAEARRFVVGDAVPVLLGERRFDAAIAAAEDALEQNPESSAVIEGAAETLFFAGRIKEALPLYERLWSLAPQGQPVSTGFWWGLPVTMRLALSRRRGGDETGALAAAEIARRKLAENRAAGEKNMEQDTTEAMLAAFEREEDRAIAALQSAVRRGFVFLLYINDPVFDDLRDDPRFVALRREIETNLNSEHEKILQLICFNNPVPDEWRPLPETCEGVMAHHRR